MPQGIFHDEAWSAAKAWNLLTGAAPAQLYFPENNGMDALHVYLIALLFQIHRSVGPGQPDRLGVDGHAHGAGYLLAGLGIARR